MAVAWLSKARARNIADWRSGGARIATSTRLCFGRPPTKSSAFWTVERSLEYASIVWKWSANSWTVE